MSEIEAITFSEVEVPEEYQDEFAVLCAKADQILAEAIRDPATLWADLHRQSLEEADAAVSSLDLDYSSTLSLSAPLATFDRSDRRQRKLDKGLRQRFSAEDGGTAEGVLMYPHDPSLPHGQLYQTLLEVYPPGRRHLVSIIRYVSNHSVTSDGSWLLATAEYRLTASPLVDPNLDRIFTKEDLAAPSVAWVLASIESGDFDEAALILSGGPAPAILNRALVAALWRRLRLAEYRKNVAELGSFATTS